MKTPSIKTKSFVIMVDHSCLNYSFPCYVKGGNSRNANTLFYVKCRPLNQLDRDGMAVNPTGHLDSLDIKPAVQCLTRYRNGCDKRSVAFIRLQPCREYQNADGNGFVNTMTCVSLSLIPCRFLSPQNQLMNGFSSGSGEKYAIDSSSDESDVSESIACPCRAACLSLSAAACLNPAIMASKEPDV